MTQPQSAIDPRRWSVLAVMVLCLFLVVLENTVLNVALRTLAEPGSGLGASPSQLEWAINAYTLVFACLLFTTGVLADRLGRRLVLISGLVVFGLGSLFAAYADSPAQLIGARAIMGLGGAAVMPVTLSIIMNVFHPREYGKAIGIWASAIGFSVAGGPLIGGLLLEHFWWGSVFLINVPVAIVAAVLAIVLVPESKNPHASRLDLVGVLMSIAGLALLTYGIINGGENGFGETSSWAAIVLGIAVLAVFLVVQSRIAFPSLDVKLFTNMRFSASVIALGVAFFAAIGSMFFMAFYLQLVRGDGPLAAGALMLPAALAQIVFAPTSSKLVERFGPKLVGAAGLVLIAAGLAGFMLFTAGTSVVALEAAFFLIGLGLAHVVPPATSTAMGSVPPEKAGVGSAVGNTIRQMGAVLGVAVLGSVLSAVYRSHMSGQDGPAGQSLSGAFAQPTGDTSLLDRASDAFLSGMHEAAMVSTAVALIGALIVLVWLPGKRPVPAAPAAGEPDKAPATAS
jgi:DHA2 family multidrug resistance protein-like MFS transporter